MRNTFLPMLSLLAACTTIPDQSVGACKVERLDDLVGRAANSELGAEAMRRSGATRLRWIQPGDVVTMDYNQSRLNIHLDAHNRAERFACG